MNVFHDYAAYYDFVYHDKNYEEECNFLELIFKKYSDKPIKNILDLGCGTGEHSLILAKMGYKIVGVDQSDEMIETAKSKAKEKNQNIDFLTGDIRELSLNKKFDVIIAMFAVMGYQVTNEDLAKTFSTVRRHLKKGGLFIFDFWFGPAVLSIMPSSTLKKVDNGDERIIRFANPELNITDSTVKVDYTILKIKGNTIIDENEEVHTVRYFFSQELQQHSRSTGFKLLRLCSFMDLNKLPSKDTWNVTCIMKGA